jgi:hypothetical protein
VALKTVPALVADSADAGAVATPPATPLNSEAGLGFVFTSVTGFIAFFSLHFGHCVIERVRRLSRLTAKESSEAP